MPTEVLGATMDGQHMLGAAIAGGGVELVGYWRVDSIHPRQRHRNGRIIANGEFAGCLSADGYAVEPAATYAHSEPNRRRARSTQRRLNQIVASPVTNLAFLTYNGTTPGAKLPYYVPARRER